MRIGRSLWATLFLCVTACSSSSSASTSPTTTVSEVLGDGAINLTAPSQSCRFGTTVVPSLTLSFGPIGVTVDADGNISFGASGQIASFGPLSLSGNLDTAGQQPSCVTVALVDTPHGKVHYMAVEPGDAEVIIRGGGRLEERIQAGLVTIEVSQLCELQIFTGEQAVPKRRQGCGGGTGYWTLTDSSYNTRERANVRVKQLQDRGVPPVGSADTGDWPSVCPPFFIVYVGQFATRDAAARRLAELNGVLYEKSYVRFLSDDPGDRPAGCPS